MKNVYFVLANKAYGKALYLPYASACLAAYAWQFDEIKENYRLCGFFFKRDPIDEVLSAMKAPDVVALTYYMWTAEYNKRLARAIRKKYPDCLIVVGGHEISPQKDPFEKCPDADVLIFGEGEIPFQRVLAADLHGRDFAGIENIVYRASGSPTASPRKGYAKIDYPSPYLAGYFDDILRENPGVEFSAILETNRGCPYGCVYCDWSNSGCVRAFPLEKVFSEIDWCSRNQIEYIFCADGNFGILARDFEIAQHVVQAKKEYGYPLVFNACYAKNSHENVFRISDLFFENGVNKAITLAYQTVSENVMQNIGRKNVSLDQFSMLIRRYCARGIPTYTELILGLPGETKQSFKDGLCSLIEAGQHNAVTVYGCQVFPNAQMSDEAFRAAFEIRTSRVTINFIHASLPKDTDIQEYTELVTSTKDMSFEDLTDTLLFSACVQAFHHIGLLKYFAIYVRQSCGVSYLDFYNALEDYMIKAEGTFLCRLIAAFRARCRDLSHGEWTYYNEKFGKIGWYLEEGLFMELVSEYETFWEEILPFLRSFQIPEPLFSQLCGYQKFAVRLPGQRKVCQTFAYDFYTYFKNALNLDPQPLEKKTIHVEVVADPQVNSWPEYALRVMLYAKKKGATLLVNDQIHTTVTCEDIEL